MPKTRSFRAASFVAAAFTAITFIACSDATPDTDPTVTPLATFYPRPTPAPDPTPPSAPPPAPQLARVVTRGATNDRAVALTFDATTEEGRTRDILRILRDNNVRATFALTGVWAERHRDLLFAIATDGHQIINNTYSHPSFTGASTGQPPLTAAERALQLSRTEVTVERYTSRPTKPYFRPPFGDYDESVRRDAAANGYNTVVLWTIDTLGWAGAPPQQITQRAVLTAQPGAIINMNTAATSADADALESIILALKDLGYTFQTITDLLD